MKIRLELEIGPESGIVVGALESLVRQLEEAKDVLPLDSNNTLYLEVCKRIVADLERQVNEVDCLLTPHS